MSDLLIVGEVAALLRVDHETVRRWCAAGKMPGAFQTPGGTWRIPREAVNRILEGGTE